MLLNLILTYKVISSTFKRYFSPLILVFGIPVLRLIVNIGMLLDRIFYKKLNKESIKNPIVIVGNPRSGTTFLQRFLVNNNIGAGMKLWKMIIPSLSLQYLLKPFIKRLEKFSPAKYHSHAAHETNLTAIETDDPALLFHYFDGFFVYGFFLAFHNEDLKWRFDPTVRNSSKRDFNWLRKVWIRNLIGEDSNRVIGKLFSLGVRLPEFLKYFSDAKILYTVRDPLETVPSGLSLVTGVLDGRYGFFKLDETIQKQYIERLYLAFLELSMRFHDDYINGKINKSNLMIVRYDRMMNDFDGLMEEVIDFLGIEADDKLKKNIFNVAEKQRNYKSEHKYNLEKYNLTEDRIRKDYEKIYKTFLS